MDDPESHVGVCDLNWVVRAKSGKSQVWGGGGGVTEAKTEGFLFICTHPSTHPSPEQLR